VTKAWVLASLPEYTAVPVIDGFWNWYRTYNTGAAFSFLANAGGWQKWFFTVLAFGISGLMAWMLSRTPRRDWKQALPLALVIGGAIGNVIDRLIMGTWSTSSSGMSASTTGRRSTSPTARWSAARSASPCSGCSPASPRSRRDNPAMDILLANPRGFCAGVDRAIEIVKRAIETLGAPIYVRHEVVHNKFVVDDLKARGAIFVEELDEVPDGNTVIFSAHGVSQAVRREADRRGLKVFDATCPLVTKVHLEVARNAAMAATWC
jgi:hypothetical protein